VSRDTRRTTLRKQNTPNASEIDSYDYRSNTDFPKKVFRIQHTRARRCIKLEKEKKKETNIQKPYFAFGRFWRTFFFFFFFFKRPYDGADRNPSTRIRVPPPPSPVLFPNGSHRSDGENRFSTALPNVYAFCFGLIHVYECIRNAQFQAPTLRVDDTFPVQHPPMTNVRGRRRLSVSCARVISRGRIRPRRRSSVSPVRSISGPLKLIHVSRVTAERNASSSSSFLFFVLRAATYRAAHDENDAWAHAGLPFLRVRRSADRTLFINLPRDPYDGEDRTRARSDSAAVGPRRPVGSRSRRRWLYGDDPARNPEKIGEGGGRGNENYRFTRVCRVERYRYVRTRRGLMAEATPHVPLALLSGDTAEDALAESESPANRLGTPRALTRIFTSTRAGGRGGLNSFAVVTKPDPHESNPNPARSACLQLRG